MNKQNYFLFTTLLLTGNLWAQNRDLASIDYTVSAVAYNDTAANANLLDVKFRLPLLNKKQHIAIGTVSYKNLSLNNFPGQYVSSLHGLTFQGAWLYKFTSRRSLTFFTQAGLFSDLKEVNSKDFRYSGGFRYRVKHSDKLSTGWGLGYSRQFFGNQIIPFIDVDYKPNNRWSITGQFPIKPKVLYHFNNKLSAGIEVFGDAASYRLSASERNNQFIQVNQWAGLAKLEYQFAKSWQLNVGLGNNFKQSYKLYDDAATTPWTIITIPLGERPDPVYKIDNKGLNIQIGVSFNPF